MRHHLLIPALALNHQQILCEFVGLSRGYINEFTETKLSSIYALANSDYKPRLVATTLTAQAT